jgi:hypothetical protein
MDETTLSVQCAQAPPQNEMLVMIERLVMDPAVDPSKLAAILEIKIKLDAIEAKAQYERAMARLQPRLPRIDKRGVIKLGKGEIPYARYEDIHAIVQPLMIAEGFSITFPSSRTPTGVLLTAKLAHAAGHSETSEMQLPADKGPGRNELQALGSALTYAKRYLLCGLLNIVTCDEDDDGISACAQYLTPAQVDHIADLLTRANILVGSNEMSNFLKYMGVEMLADIRASDFSKAVTALNAKLRKMAISGDPSRRMLGGRPHQRE